MSDRGQSNVVGVALLLAIAVISMGALTAAVGVVVDSTAARADADRVAAEGAPVKSPPRRFSERDRREHSVARAD